MCYVGLVKLIKYLELKIFLPLFKGKNKTPQHTPNPDKEGIIEIKDKFNNISAI